MREVRIMRALVALICVALLVCAVSPSGVQLDLAVFVLPFSFLVVFAVSLLLFSEPAVQSLSLLNLNTSRAPPLA
jgi:hypothetical protein